MKNWIIRLIILIIYSVPYAYMAMNGDATSGTMLFYGIMFLFLGLLCFFSIKTNNFYVIIIGNILSYFSSYIFIIKNQTDKWDWYFKPFTSNTLLIIISAAVFLIQLAFLLHFYKKRIK